MAQYTKHNSNYIKTKRHQHLKDGSTIFERDWVTIGSQLHFGSGKIPYYRNGNFIFTNSALPTYQKKYKNGSLVAVWTYDDVENVSSVINQIDVDENTEDIRSFVYYGSCVELVIASVENIIRTFPGNITSSGEELDMATDECNSNGVLEGYYTLNNPFQIDIKTKDVVIAKNDNELRYLTYSYPKYTFNGAEISQYEVITRKMYEKVMPICYETVKDNVLSTSFNSVNSLENKDGILEQTIFLTEGRYYLVINGTKNSDWTIKYKDSVTPDFSIEENKKAVKIVCDNSKNISLILNDNTELPIIKNFSQDSATIEFYKERKIPRQYKFFQMFDDDEYNNIFKAEGWVESDCIMSTWLPDTQFYNPCDEYQSCILLSEISGLGYNQPAYTVTINGTDTIEGYVYNNQVVPLIKRNDFVIQPKDEVIEEYFNGLTGFEKQLLNRKSQPLYSNKFITPIEYNLGYVYYKRTYTWPSNGYCIDMTSTRYLDFLTKLTDMAQLYDELWTDNIWRRMTHESIKNYDLTYTREFEDGEEQDNIDGGERMHKVLNIIGRVFDDIKKYIDLSKHVNRATYNGDRNMANATLRDKLELLGWEVYSTIPNLSEDTKENLADITIGDDFLNANKGIKWYSTKNCKQFTFADADIDFMRRMILSSKRILQTKGTLQGIDMVMGMFGYGNESDYSIREEYYTVTPKQYEEIFTSSNLNSDTLGDAIVELNTSKANGLLYDDDVSGIPVGSFKVSEVDKEDKTKLNTVTYLIPYYDQNKIYDGEFYFQSKGGWMYDKDREVNNEINSYGWKETLSYLHVVSTVGGLLEVNPMTVSIGDIYYVTNINDYIDYTEEEIKSRFFVLEDEYNPERFRSWTNLDLTGEDYKDASDKDKKKYSQYIEKANYLNSIIPDNIGNNPHVGYGKYDNGNEYLEYMRTPFKYSIDTNNIDSLKLQDAENITFNISDPQDVNLKTDKIQIFEGGVTETDVKYNGKTVSYKEYDKNKIIKKQKETYYLNSKVIYLTNKIDNDFYKKYFKTVIMHYLMQVVPSTSIMILENFD